MIPPLPEELLGLILEHLALPHIESSSLQKVQRGDRDCYRECLITLSNACLASKTLHRLAWPILYRRFTNYPLSAGQSRPDKLDPVQFLQTICTRPEYGLALRSLSMNTWESFETMDPSQVFDLLQGDATLAALFDWRVRGFWFGEDHTTGDNISVSSDKQSSDPSLLSAILHTLKMGLPEAHMVMLLLLCPKIKEWNIWSPPHSDFSLVIRLLEVTLSKGYQTAKPPDPVYDFDQDESDYALARMFETSWRVPELQKSAMLQDLKRCALRGEGMPPFSFGFFRKLLDLPALQDLLITSLQGGYGASIGDLKIDMPCIQLKKLTLVDCRLRTCEVSAIIQCCPNLLDLSIQWDMSMGDNVDIIHNDPAKQDYRLRFGHIGDAIASHVPKLESLNVASHQWKYRHSVLEYPYTIGEALRPLEHLKYLSLDHCVIYGDEDGGLSDCTLSEAVPYNVTKLHIGPNLLGYGTSGVEEPRNSWQVWQIDDLNKFLQNGSLKHLRVVDLVLNANGSEGYIDQPAVLRHGWVITEQNDWCCKLENRGRPAP